MMGYFHRMGFLFSRSQTIALLDLWFIGFWLLALVDATIRLKMLNKYIELLWKLK